MTFEMYRSGKNNWRRPADFDYEKKNISEHNGPRGIHEITEMLNYSRPRV
jgi:hypothetical protein